jgi:phage terminase large subunit-like protein
VGEITRGERNARWIEEFCRVPEGALVGQAVELRAWQRDIMCGIYDSPTRRAIVSFGRKNGKTALAAFLLLLHLCGPEARANSQLYSAAQSREQAAILFSLAAKVVRQSPDLSQYVVVRDTAKELVCPELGSKYRALSAEASTAYGLSPVFVVHDELGQVKGPRSELYEALETASAAQSDPLSIIISTQAPTDADLLSVLIEDARQGGDPLNKIWLYTAPETADPFSDEAIRAANPAFGDFQNPAEVRRQAESARRMPSSENGYRNLILNQRVNLSNPFVSRGVWESCSNEADPEAFQEGEVFVGLDLSARHDLTAAVAVAKFGGIWHVMPTFFAPQHGLAERSHKDRVPYDVWARDGRLLLTPGATVDYAYVAQWLADFCADHPVRAVRFDRWRIDVLKAELARIGVDLPLEPFGQGFKDMTPALDTLEAELVEGNVRHGGHPVLTMCAANAVATRDAAGNRKLDKSKATGRIDGMVALAMAIGAASAAGTIEPDFSEAIASPLILRR